MHLRELQAIAGLGGPRQSPPQGGGTHRADGVGPLQRGGGLVPPDGTPLPSLPGPSLVPHQARTVIRRPDDDLAAGSLRREKHRAASRPGASVKPETPPPPASPPPRGGR